jgi:hypothetical protein
MILVNSPQVAHSSSTQEKRTSKCGHAAQCLTHMPPRYYQIIVFTSTCPLHLHDASAGNPNPPKQSSKPETDAHPPPLLIPSGTLHPGSSVISTSRGMLDRAVTLLPPGRAHLPSCSLWRNMVAELVRRGLFFDNAADNAVLRQGSAQHRPLIRCRESQNRDHSQS